MHTGAIPRAEGAYSASKPLPLQERAFQKFGLMARPAGIEPATRSLEGCCSIQLSYGRVLRMLTPDGQAFLQLRVYANTPM
jgi:hypothetical protein